MSRSQQPHKRFLMRLYWNHWRIQPKTSNEALNGMLRQAGRVAGQSLSGCARRRGLLSRLTATRQFALTASGKQPLPRFTARHGKARGRHY